MKLPKFEAVTFKHVVGCVILYLFWYSIKTIATNEIPEGNREIFIHVLGIIEGSAITIVSFYFGSSASSKAKSKVIEEHIEGQAANDGK